MKYIDPDCPSFEIGDFADNYLRWLGFYSAQSLDRSNFEGASIIADLCKPVPTSLHEKFDVVFDGGTVEHLVDPLMGIKNAAALTKDGGITIWITTANNQLGHGLWQLSPELFYRVLIDQLGYRDITIVCIEMLRHKCINYWRALDPAEAQSRTELRNAYPIQLVCVGKKGNAPEKAIESVAQSDYAAAWRLGTYRAGEPPARVRSLFSKISRSVGVAWLGSIRPGRFPGNNYHKLGESSVINLYMNTVNSHSQSRRPG